MEEQALSPSKSQPKLLIVDDEAKLCRVLEEHFALKGYEVKTVLSGQDAVAMAYVFQPTIVLLDLLMPGGMSGIDTLKELKQFLPTSKILMISAADHEEVVKGALKLGANFYVCKPLNLLELDELINRCYTPS